MAPEPLFPRAGFIQFAVRRGDVDANLATLGRLLDGLAAEQDIGDALLVLPELWATGFDYARLDELGRRSPGVLAALEGLAARHGCYLAGSLIEPRPPQAPGNTLVLVGPEGELGRYGKQHLFAFWHEDRHFSPGPPPAGPLATPHGPLAALVCYDLRFPELARDQVFAGARVIAVSAQWPARRLDHWQALLAARAIENQAFVVACNCCGNAMDIAFPGASSVIAPDGTVLARAGEGPEARCLDLDPDLLREQRERFCAPAERPWTGRDADKVVDRRELERRLALLRRQPVRVVFTNGCFDILHAGHVHYLEEARRAGDLLVVGLNSDASVRGLKGPGRPVNHEQDRARVLAALGCVDLVCIFEEPDPGGLIRLVRPDVLVKGADWAEEDIVGADQVKAAGGQVLRIPFARGLSTTAIMERCRGQGAAANLNQGADHADTE